MDHLLNPAVISGDVRCMNCSQRFASLFTLAFVCVLTMAHSVSRASSDPVDDGSTPGLRAYFVSNTSGVSHIGHVDWAAYDQLVQVDQLNWPVASGRAFYEDGPTTSTSRHRAFGVSTSAATTAAS